MESSVAVCLECALECFGISMGSALEWCCCGVLLLSGIQLWKSTMGLLGVVLLCSGCWCFEQQQLIFLVFLVMAWSIAAAYQGSVCMVQQSRPVSYCAITNCPSPNAYIAWCS
ncbi:hypothetical protein U1Q18_017535 [Sarracenia purpurea var. burkii]